MLGLAAVLLAAALPAPASASVPSPSYAETRVRGFELQHPASVGAERALSPTRTGAYAARYDELASGYPLVPRGTAAADDLLELPASQSWGRLETLEDHFVRHGRDFSATSADEYARQASRFLQRAERQGLPTKIDPRTGVIRVYDPATSTFGSYNPSGTTRTFYKPNPAVHGYPTNLDYWNAQPGGAPWAP